MIRSILDNSRTDPPKWLDLEVISAPFLIVVILLLATMGLISTIWSLIILLPIILYFKQRYYSLRNNLRQTKFFISWSISSLIILISVFELQVVPYLEILFVENFILILLTTSALILVIIIRKNEFDSKIVTNLDQSIYNHWIRSTISQKFKVIYIISQVLATTALLYGSHLALTTICHSHLLYQSVLIPDDCSEVYTQFDIRLSFVCAVYSIQISFCIIFYLLRRVFSWILSGNKPEIKYIRLNRIES